MRYLVNGELTELEPASAVEVVMADDRLMVKSAEGRSSALSVRSGDRVLVSYKGQTYEVEKPSAGKSKGKPGGNGTTLAPMPGQIVEIFVEKGQQVESGQKLLVLEAMKMQHAVTAPFDGVIGEIPAQKGDQVSEGQLLVRVDAAHG